MSLPSVWEPRKLYKQNFLVSTTLRKSSKTRKEKKSSFLVPTRGTRMIIDYLKFIFIKCLYYNLYPKVWSFFRLGPLKVLSFFFFLNLFYFKFCLILFSICDHSIHEVLFCWHLTTRSIIE